MRLIGQDVLAKSLKRHPDVRKWIAAWVVTVEDADWWSIEDIRRDYPSADGVKLKSRIVVTVFNVKGNEYRLLTNVNYPGQVVQALELLTHAEYDKELFGNRGIKTMPVLTKKHSTDTYFELVHEFPLRRLRNAAEHHRAKAVYLRLSARKADRGTRDYLDVLADLVAEYEKRTRQAIDTSELTAADLVRHRLEERGMSVSALARAIGLPQPNLADMLNGRRDWSKTAIRELSKMWNIRAERFLA